MKKAVTSMENGNSHRPTTRKLAIARAYVLARMNRSVSGSVKLSTNSKAPVLWPQTSMRKLIELFNQAFVLGWLCMFLAIAFSGHRLFPNLNFYLVFLSLPIFLLVFFLFSEIVRIVMLFAFEVQGDDEAYSKMFANCEIPRTLFIVMRRALANVYMISHLRISVAFCSNAIPILTIFSNPLAEEFLEELKKNFEDAGIRSRLGNCTPQMLAGCDTVNELFVRVAQLVE
jgi:hypothetical protein